MKKCYRCKETKPFEEFHQSSSSKDGRRKACKECKKIINKEDREKRRDYYLDYMKKWNAEKKDGYHSVYLLEDYNYVGTTDNVYLRFAVHKSRDNRDCTNHRILFTSSNRDECLEIEELLHNMGYKGAEKGNSYR